MISITRDAGSAPAFAAGTNSTWRMTERLGPFPSKLRDAPSRAVSGLTRATAARVAAILSAGAALANADVTCSISCAIRAMTAAARAAAPKAGSFPCAMVERSSDSRSAGTGAAARATGDRTNSRSSAIVTNVIYSSRRVCFSSKSFHGSRTRPRRGLNLWVWPEIRHNPIGEATRAAVKGRVGDRINAAPPAAGANFSLLRGPEAFLRALIAALFRTSPIVPLVKPSSRARRALPRQRRDDRLQDRDDIVRPHFDLQAALPAIDEHALLVGRGRVDGGRHGALLAGGADAADMVAGEALGFGGTHHRGGFAGEGGGDLFHGGLAVRGDAEADGLALDLGHHCPHDELRRGAVTFR